MAYLRTSPNSLLHSCASACVHIAMTTTTADPIRDPDDTIRMQPWLRRPTLPLAVAWWRRQAQPARTGLILAALFAFAGTLSLCASVTQQGGAAIALKPEASAPDAGKSWVAAKSWQGRGNRETETFT